SSGRKQRATTLPDSIRYGMRVTPMSSLLSIAPRSTVHGMPFPPPRAEDLFEKRTIAFRNVACLRALTSKALGSQPRFLRDLSQQGGADRVALVECECAGGQPISDKAAMRSLLPSNGPPDPEQSGQDDGRFGCPPYRHLRSLLRHKRDAHERRRITL